jgi:hypothetical protein
MQHQSLKADHPSGMMMAAPVYALNIRAIQKQAPDLASFYVFTESANILSGIGN